LLKITIQIQTYRKNNGIHSKSENERMSEVRIKLACLLAKLSINQPIRMHVSFVLQTFIQILSLRAGLKTEALRAYKALGNPVSSNAKHSAKLELTLNDSIIKNIGN